MIERLIPEFRSRTFSSDRFYPTFWKRFSIEQPEMEQYVRWNVASGYEPAFHNEYYTVYRRSGGGSREQRQGP